jgi:lysine biosynthesis protein LysW
MTQAYCPECDAEVGLGNPVKPGKRITCQSCGAYLEVIDTNPVELDWAFDDDIDDDDLYDDDDY